MRRLAAAAERWPLAAPFVIARGVKTEAHVVVVEVAQDGARGRGECTPYARYDESVDGVLLEIAAVRDAVEAGLGRPDLQRLVPPGAARNAVDCALWDLEAKLAGARTWTLAGMQPPEAVETAFTLSLASAEAMAEAARAAARRPLLKIKIGGGDDLDRVEAVRAAAPDARLVVDANEAFDFGTLRRLAPEFMRLRVEAIEQPMPAGADEELEGWACPVPLYADESLHTRAELQNCARRYAGVNVKLDKSGGLTEALALRLEARARGLSVMVGCMVATSLAMAPAFLLTPGAAVVDLDGPLLLAHDRPDGLAIRGSTLEPPTSQLWG